MFTVTVKPNSATNSIELIKPDVYRITTTALPEKGAANQQVIKILADYLDIPKSSLEIKSGFGSRTKLIDLI
ncbi:MAG: DUF167 domain-containing protein [bacterium]|nr:DUF167 domain-containing protein [bacterium]